LGIVNLVYFLYFCGSSSKNSLKWKTAQSVKAIVFVNLV